MQTSIQLFRIMVWTPIKEGDPVYQIAQKWPIASQYNGCKVLDELYYYNQKEAEAAYERIAAELDAEHPIELERFMVRGGFGPALTCKLLNIRAPRNSSGQKTVV